MKQYLQKSLAPVFLLCVAACSEPLTAKNSISGELKLFLHKQEAVGLYVRFELAEVESSTPLTVIASSGFQKITEHPVHFSLSFPVEKINKQNHYRLFTTVSKDILGNKEVTSMSLPVLTYGNASIVNMAINPLTKPVE